MTDDANHDGETNLDDFSLAEPHAETQQVDSAVLHESLVQLDHWMQDLQRCVETTYTLPRWRIPAFAKRVVNAIMFRPRQPEVDWHAENILRQYQKWRMLAVQNNLVPAALYHEPVRRNSKIALVGQLATFAIAHPIRTYQQINRDNLRVFIDLFFRGSAARTNTAVDNFLETHGGDTGQYHYPHNENLPRSFTFPESDHPLVSIIVPVFNNLDSTFACLGACLIRIHAWCFL